MMFAPEEEMAREERPFSSDDGRKEQNGKGGSIPRMLPCVVVLCMCGGAPCMQDRRSYFFMAASTFSG